MKYDIGEKVIFFDEEPAIVLNVKPNSSADTIKKDLYIIKLQDGTIKTVSESFLSKIGSKTETSDNNDTRIEEINNKIKTIFNDLGIEKTDDVDEQKKIAFLLFKYVIENSKYDEIIMEEKSNINDLFDMEVQDIYNCLCLKRSVCTSDASTLSLLFRRAGIESTHLTIADKGNEVNGVHEVVKMSFGGKQYLCDPTLVRTSLEEGIIPNIHPSIFAFTPDKFFDVLYKSKEIKFEHKPILK